jgi:hypothetical protein
MYYEVELRSCITVTVEAENEDQAEDLARDAATDLELQDEFGENAEVTTIEEVDDKDGTVLFVDGSGNVHRG